MKLFGQLVMSSFLLSELLQHTVGAISRQRSQINFTEKSKLEYV